MKMHKFSIKNTILLLCLIGLLTGCGKQEEQQAKQTAAGTQTETTAVEPAGEETQEQASLDEFVFTLASNNSWENNGMQCAQFDGTIRNQTESAGSDWKITLPVPEGAKLESSWNGTYAIEGTTLTITPVDYNKEIPAGGEITLGFIMDTSEAFTPESGTLTIGGKDYALGGGAGSGTEEKQAEAKEETNPDTEPKEVATKDTSGTPVANHGALSVKGTDIVDKDGKVFQLKGVSTHGINWFPDYVNEEAFSSLAGFGVNAIRLAMYTADNSGYCSGGNPEQLEALLDTGVNACTNLGLYAIVDWHILSDNDPTQYQDQAKTFFEKVSKKYAGNDNVIYEICNEPNGGTTWETVKAYAEKIIPIIRKNDKDALIIVGTPNWSQDVDIAADNQITGQSNIVYAAHFYASTHKDDIRNKVKTARDKGLPVIISECSICEASGNGSINYDEADKWMDLINEYHLSYFAWNLSNKDEQSSLLKPSVTKTGGFSKEDFSETGTWFLTQFSK